MLNDQHINYSLELIRKDFPEIKGLQSTLNVQKKGGFQNMHGEESIQIFYCDEVKHWVTTCCIDKKVLLYDSLPMLSIPETLENQMIAVYGKESTTLEVVVPVTQKQTNCVDCGCFAIAWAYIIAIGEKPELINLDIKKLRSHIEECFKNKKLIPFPHSIKRIKRVHTKTFIIISK